MGLPFLKQQLNQPTCSIRLRHSHDRKGFSRYIRRQIVVVLDSLKIQITLLRCETPVKILVGA